jgi:hypothetical protein
MNEPTNSEALPLTNCSSSFWDTPETDEAVASAECESDLVMSMRSMEKRMNDAIQEATNAVNDIIRVRWERDEAIKEGAKHISLWHQTLREMEILKFGLENTPANNNNQNENETK